MTNVKKGEIIFKVPVTPYTIHPFAKLPLYIAVTFEPIVKFLSFYDFLLMRGIFCKTKSDL